MNKFIDETMRMMLAIKITLVNMVINRLLMNIMKSTAPIVVLLSI